MKLAIIRAAIPLILSALKDPQNKKKIRGVMLKIFLAIKASYGDDEAFQ
jgi:hypothetical protein